MKLSIIIPALNEAQTIRRFLQPLQTLRTQGHELILVDGYSSDGTAELARSLVDQLLYSERGRAKQMNCGAKAARGDILLFLHADTTLPNNAAQLITAALSTSCWGRFNVRLSGQSFQLRIIETLMNWRSCLTGICTGDQAIFVTTEAFKQIGGYTDIPLMEDIVISRTLKKLSPPSCIKTTVTTSSQRWEEKGILRTVLFMWTLRLKFFLGTPAKLLVEHYYPKHSVRSPEKINACRESNKLADNTALLVFSKAPISGNVKTRLIPDIGANNACALHALLTHHTLQKLTHNQQLAMQLWVDPDNLEHPFVKGCATDFQISIHQQQGHDLGERMNHACRQTLQTCNAVILVGTDCPMLDKHIINNVLINLENNDAVLIPAIDGGYVLLALSRHHHKLFENIEWGTDRVLSQSLERLMTLGWKYYLFDAQRDLDDRADLEHFSRLPATRHIFNSLTQ